MMPESVWLRHNLLSNANITSENVSVIPPRVETEGDTCVPQIQTHTVHPARVSFAAAGMIELSQVSQARASSAAEASLLLKLHVHCLYFRVISQICNFEAIKVR